MPVTRAERRPSRPRARRRSERPAAPRGSRARRAASRSGCRRRGRPTSGSITRLSTRIGRSAGRPNGVTPPISMSVSSRTGSAAANDALRTPISRRTAPLTSSDVVARRTQATYRGSAPLPTTTIVFALCAAGIPYAATNAAVSASAGSHSQHLVRNAEVVERVPRSGMEASIEVASRSTDASTGRGEPPYAEPMDARRDASPLVTVLAVLVASRRARRGGPQRGRPHHARLGRADGRGRPVRFYEASGSIYPALLYPLWALGALLDGAALDARHRRALSIPFDLAIGVAPRRRPARAHRRRARDSRRRALPAEPCRHPRRPGVGPGRRCRHAPLPRGARGGGEPQARSGGRLRRRRAAREAAVRARPPAGRCGGRHSIAPAAVERRTVPRAGWGGGHLRARRAAAAPGSGQIREPARSDRRATAIHVAERLQPVGLDRRVQGARRPVRHRRIGAARRRAGAVAASTAPLTRDAHDPRRRRGRRLRLLLPSDAGPRALPVPGHRRACAVRRRRSPASLPRTER